MVTRRKPRGCELYPIAQGHRERSPRRSILKTEIAQNTDAAVIIPDIMVDGRLYQYESATNYVQELVRSRPAVSRAVIGMLTRAPRLELGNYLRPERPWVSATSFRFLLVCRKTVRSGSSRSEGILALHRKVLVLTYDFAEFVTQTSFRLWSRSSSGTICRPTGIRRGLHALSKG